MMRTGTVVRALLFCFLFSAFADAVERVGILSYSPPFSNNEQQQSVLRDEITLLWQQEKNPPQITNYTRSEEALAALNAGKLDLVISAQDFSRQGLLSSQPILVFPLAVLGNYRPGSTLLASPEILTQRQTSSQGKPLNVIPAGTTIYDSVRRIIRGEASGLIAPEFAIAQFRQQVPQSTLPWRELSAHPPLRYSLWVAANHADRLAALNQRIDNLRQQDARWLEHKWQLPANSVISQRNPPPGKEPVSLRVALLYAPEPRIIHGNAIRGMWRDLLNSQFPPPFYRLTVTPVSDKKQARQLLNLGKVDLLMGETTPLPTDQAVRFDTLSWGIVSHARHPLNGSLTSLQSKRLAIIRGSPLATLPALVAQHPDIVKVNTLRQGISLVEAGGADGLIGDAWSLDYLLRRANNRHLSLSVIDLPQVPLWFVTTADDSPKMQQVRNRLSAMTDTDIQVSKTRWTIEVPPISADQHHLWTSLLAMLALLAASGSVLFIARERSKNKIRIQQYNQLSDTLNLWQTLLNSAPIPLFFCDPIGRIRSMNQAFHDSPFIPDGFESGELLGEIEQGPFHWLDPSTRQTLLYDTRPILREVTLGQNTLLCWIAGYSNSQGIAQGMVGGWLDISEKAALEEALSQSLRQAEKASEEKSAFLARMSHDIRTPLNAILGMLEIERKPHPSLEVAWQAALTLRDLVGDILDLSRIEAGELHLAPARHNLHEIMETAAAIFARSAQEKGLAWHHDNAIPDELWCLCDRSRLNQIIANLAGNAIKYTHEGEVSLICRYQESILKIEVTDTGIGIPEAQLPILFQPWFQLDSSVPQSSGLGLAICHQIIALMNGEITIESTEGKGTTVSVTLPVVPCQIPEKEPLSLAPDAILAPRRILLADDFPANLTVMTRQLERAGHQVESCLSGQEALARLEHESFDVLITDCQMPGMSGYQLCASVVLHYLLGRVTLPAMILGCTASALPREEEEARHAGMDRLLRKPLSEAGLRQALDTLPETEGNSPNLEELRALAGEDSSLVTLMLSQIDQAIDEDLRRLQEQYTDLQLLSQTAHRLKNSWSLLRMQQSWRLCQIMENLPASYAGGIVSQAELPDLVNAFIAQMRSAQRQIRD
jgi:two-component system sensor histidine kinase EvgS